MAEDGRHGSSRTLAACAACVALFALLLLVWWPRPAIAWPQSPVGSESKSGPATDGASCESGAAAALGARPTGYPQPISREPVHPGVFGALLDNQGAPLAGFLVALERQHDHAPEPSSEIEIVMPDDAQPYFQQPSSLQVTRTDEHGHFAWRHPDAGTYVVRLVAWPDLYERFELAADGHELVDLQLTEDLVATEGHFRRNGEVETDLLPCLGSAPMPDGLTESADLEGRIRMIAPVGVHRMRAMVRQCAAAGSWSSLGAFQLAVPAGKPRLSWQFEVGGTDIDVVVVGPSGFPVPRVMVHLAGTTTQESNELHWQQATEQQNRASFRRVPPGSYFVRAEGREVLTCEPLAIVALPGDRRLEVPLTVREAATVTLRLRTHGGRAPHLSMSEMPPLQTVNGDVPCTDLANSGYHSVGRRVLGYQSVTPGPVSLSWQDRIVDGERDFLPFEPVAETTAEVEAGRRNVIEVEVEPRGFVDLRACDRSGLEQLGAAVDVFRGAERVRSSETKFQNRWQSYLPAGDYRVVVDRDGLVREHALVVVGRDVRLRLRP